MVILGLVGITILAGCSTSPTTGGNAGVASVSVAPAAASINVGGTVQLVATPRDANGDALAGAVVSWSSSAPIVASVSPGGLVSGQGTGSATITAASEGKSGTADITVTGGASSPTLLFQESFDDPNLASRGWYDLPDAGITSISTAEHIPGSTASLEIDFGQGQVTPVPDMAARHLFTASESVYLRYWVKYSANWVGSGHSYHPHELYFLTSEDPQYVVPAYTHLTTYIEHNYQNGGFAVLAAQDAANIDESRVGQDLTGITENRAACGCNGNTDGTPGDCYLSGTLHYNGKEWKSAQAVFQPNPGPGYKGDWHMVEAYLKLNSIQGGIGQLDGVAQYWFDGQLVIDRRNVLLRTGAHPTMKFNQFLMGPYIGDGSPVSQKMWVDELVVLTGKP